MSMQSDFVSTYRGLLGQLLQTRAKLEAMGKLIPDTGVLLDAGDPFQGSNSDLVKADVLAAKTILTTLNDSLTTEHTMALVKVAGTAGLPKV